MGKLTTSSAWRKLQLHQKKYINRQIKDLFAEDSMRAEKLSISVGELSLDFSKNAISDETIDLLMDLLEQQSFSGWREKLFTGEKINHTEDRAVLHTALRQKQESSLVLEGEDIIPAIAEANERMRGFAKQVHQHEWLGHNGKPITHIVNIGIGGSDLGPKLVVSALKDFSIPGITSHFVSSVDPDELEDALKGCKPDDTLFIIASKTFGTHETLFNAKIVKQWMLDNGVPVEQLGQHLAAVTSNNEAAIEFGVKPAQIFPMWDWVGGRFSLWSSIGLSILLAVGEKNHTELLEGAHLMDEHFKNAPLRRNMPVIMAMLGVWYNNFCGAQTQAILPYSYRLSEMPRYLQQIDMESNGKSIDRDGEDIDYQTGPVIWGVAGTNGQHAFFQLLHQGTKLVPCDFITTRFTSSGRQQSQNILNANCIAQMEALMMGRPTPKGKSVYQSFSGSRPSNIIYMEKITPSALGSLIALYEHKVFVQGVVWNINSYDQWGVEYGKELAEIINKNLRSADEVETAHDGSTLRLIKALKAEKT